MPNHIKNKIEIIGTDEQIEEIIDFVKSKDSENKSVFDFNNIIPIPTELNIEASSDITILEESYDFDRSTFKDYVNKIKKHYDKLDPENKQKRIINFTQGIKNYLTYGFATWYGSNCEFWGTKWNAYESYIEDNIIYFQTAWSCPFIVIEKLSELFPLVKVKVTYADENSGSNTGKLLLQDGVYIEKNKPDS